MELGSPPVLWLFAVAMVEESSLRQSETFPKIDHDIDHLDHLDPNRTTQWLCSSPVAMVELPPSVRNVSTDQTDRS